MQKSDTETEADAARRTRVDTYFKDYVKKHRRVPRWSDVCRDPNAPSMDTILHVYGVPSDAGHYILADGTFADVLKEILGLPAVDESVAAYLDGRSLVHFRARDVQCMMGVYTAAQYGQWLSKLAVTGLVHGYRIECRSGATGKQSKLYTATLIDEDAVIDAQSVLDRIHELNLANSSASPESALRQLLAKAGDSLTFCASDLVDSDSRKRSKASRYGRYLSRKVGDVVDGYLLSSTTIHNNRVYTATKVQPWHEAATYLKPGEVTTECTQ